MAQVVITPLTSANAASQSGQTAEVTIPNKAACYVTVYAVQGTVGNSYPAISVDGLGLTWALVAVQDMPGGSRGRRLEVHLAVNTSGAGQTGTISISAVPTGGGVWDSHGWSVIIAENVDTAAPNGEPQTAYATNSNTMPSCGTPLPGDRVFSATHSGTSEGSAFIPDGFTLIHNLASTNGRNMKTGYDAEDPQNDTPHYSQGSASHSQIVFLIRAQQSPAYTPPPPNAELDPDHPLYPYIMAMMIVEGGMGGNLRELVGGASLIGTPKYVNRGVDQWAVDFDGTYGLRWSWPTWPITPPGPFDYWNVLVGEEVLEMSTGGELDNGLYGIWPIAPTDNMPFLASRYNNYDDQLSLWPPPPGNRFNWTGSNDVRTDLIGQGYHVHGLAKGGTGAGTPTFANFLYLYDDSIRTPRNVSTTMPWGVGGDITFALSRTQAPSSGNKHYFYWMLVFKSPGNVPPDPELLRSLAYDPWQLVREGGGGPPGFSGGLAATEQRDVGAFAGTSSRVGTLAPTEQRDTADFFGTLIPSFSEGDLAALERLDVGAFAGNTFNPGTVEGAILAQELRDLFAASGVVSRVGRIQALEQRDLASFPGSIIPSFSEGDLAAIEPRDVGAFEGDTFDPGAIGGNLRATEPRDLAAFSGAKTFFGSAPLLETIDRGAFQGIIRKLVDGTFAAVEPLDKAVIRGDGLEEDDVANSIALRDANTGIGATPDASWKDGAPLSGDGVNIPTAIGLPAVPDNFMNVNGVVRQARLVQALGDTPAGTPVIPGFVCNVDVKAGEWCWCYSLTQFVPDDDNPIGMPPVSTVIGG